MPGSKKYETGKLQYSHLPYSKYIYISSVHFLKEFGVNMGAFASS
jgi:hypothetical protein